MMDIVDLMPLIGPRGYAAAREYFPVGMPF